jgi:hypothetical protein
VISNGRFGIKGFPDRGEGIRVVCYITAKTAKIVGVFLFFVGFSFGGGDFSLHLHH